MAQLKLTSEEWQEMFPQVHTDVAECAKATFIYMQQNVDLPVRWLCEQWHAAMMSMPEFSSEQAPYLLKHMGYIALTMQRIGLPEYPVFQRASAGMMKAFEKIMEVDLGMSSALASVQNDSGIVH